MTGIKSVLVLAGLLASGLVTSYAVLGSHSAPAPPASTTVQQGAAPVDSRALIAVPEIPPVQPRELAAARARAALATRRRRTHAPNP
jgi:hypothetical protein